MKSLIKVMTLLFVMCFICFFTIGCDKSCKKDPTQEKCQVAEKTCEEDPTQEKCKEKTLINLINYDIYKYFAIIDISKEVIIKDDLLLSNYSGSLLLQRVLSSQYEVLTNVPLIREELIIRLSTKPSAYSANRIIDLYIGDNRLYSSIKKELVVKVNGVDYLIKANRDDLFELYYFLLNIETDITNLSNIPATPNDFKK